MNPLVHFLESAEPRTLTMTSPLLDDRRRLSLSSSDTLSQDLSRAILASSRPKFSLSIDTKAIVQQPAPPPPSPVGFPASMDEWSNHEEDDRRMCS